MAGYGLAALSGLVGGLGKLPVGMQQADELNLQRERLGQGQQQIDLQRQILESSKFADLPPGMLPQSYGAQAGPGGNVRVPTAMLPFLGQQRTEEVKTERAKQERGGQAAAFRRAAQTTGNAGLNTLADLIEAGGIKDPGTVYEAELKGQQGVAEKNSGLEILRAILGPSFNLPEPMGPRGAGAGTPQPTAGVSPDLADAQKGVAAAAQGVNQAVGAYNATPGSVPGLITPPGGVGAGGGPSPMPFTAGAFKPDISIKAGPATINLKTPTDERDAVASSMFRGRYFHQLRPEEQAQVVRALGDEKVRISAAQGQNAADRPARTPEAQIKDFAGIDLAQGQLNELMRLAPSVQMPQIAGGLAPWVNAIATTGKVGPIPVPPEISGTLTPDQTRFLAMLQDYADQVLRLRSGAQINEQEFKRMLGFLASQDVRPEVIMERLRLQQDFLRAKREAIGTTLQGAGYRVPPPAAPSFERPAGSPPPVTLPEPQAAPQPNILQRMMPGVFGGPQGPGQSQPPPSQPQAAPGQPAQGKVRVISPDGRPGMWDLSRGPIPPGFRQVP